MSKKQAPVKRRRVTVRLSQEACDKLIRLAQEQNVSTSQAIEQAIETYLRIRKPVGGKS